mmetsp:Transcript_39632/g.64253  ORF Transcript_39632/g.64253 Transcript_39632/m.64253 type:complete len:126 (+) Transcript_39632:100-477(+)
MHDFKLPTEYNSLRFGSRSVFQNRHGQYSIDWRDPSATRELTKAILSEDFQLDWDIPSNQLCPTITLRANYIHWLKELMQQNSSSRTGAAVQGVDIGAGYSCIYPLLGTKIAGWSFLGTDIPCWK